MKNKIFFKAVQGAVFFYGILSNLEVISLFNFVNYYELIK